jgi:hypothetical protein
MLCRLLATHAILQAKKPWMMPEVGIDPHTEAIIKNVIRYRSPCQRFKRACLAFWNVWRGN